ncbi:sugar phosphate isomerase/epimerase [Streptomyces sp. B3I8]|uniref:sugar phosphate isomerase/epimerase family protein n=1 Tax=Streptomyces sp. B3I8 TaxID=3042303 RepID=UPI0027822706|nr:sugar phosphate isomerase/epimerase family protein [Streptomyces sp. B3I8]MDQ0791255.1 sugar phosphate isomerase/epimerase [Streptomyces sp. B3I8]
MPAEQRPALPPAPRRPVTAPALRRPVAGRATHVPSGPPPGIRYAGIGDEAAPGLAGQLTALRELGWSAMELRSVDGRSVADLDDRAFGRLAERLAAAGTEVVCVDSRIADHHRPVTGPFARDTDELGVLARRCAVLGTRYVRVMSYPNDGLGEAEWGRRVRQRMTVLARRAEDSGLVLLHENCAGWAGTRAERMLDLLHHVDSPALRLLFDTGNGVPHGYGSAALLRAVADFVEHVHVKDAVRARTGEVAYVLPGHGHAEVRECLTTLLRRGRRGTWSIEPHTRLRPHDGTDTRGDDGVAAFVAHGRELERLVAREVLPAVTPAPHGGRHD